MAEDKEFSRGFMQLTTKGRYAVTAMVDLATHAKGAPVQLSLVSARQSIDLGYLEQIFIKLKKVELVKSTRGPGGGYQLAREAGSITIFDIMDAVEEGLRMTKCIKGLGGCKDDKALCVTHHLWEELGNHISLYLRSITLQDICLKKFRLNFPYEAGSEVRV